MANDLGGRNWVVDTAGAGAIYSTPVNVHFVEVVGGAAGTIGNDMAIVNDGSGRNIIYSKYQTANAGELQTYYLDNVFQGIIVPTLGTGVSLRIHIR